MFLDFIGDTLAEMRDYAGVTRLSKPPSSSTNARAPNSARIARRSMASGIHRGYLTAIGVQGAGSDKMRR